MEALSVAVEAQQLDKCCSCRHNTLQIHTFHKSLQRSYILQKSLFRRFLPQLTYRTGCRMRVQPLCHQLYLCHQLRRTTLTHDLSAVGELASHHKGHRCDRTSHCTRMRSRQHRRTPRKSIQPLADRCSCFVRCRTRSCTLEQQVLLSWMNQVQAALVLALYRPAHNCCP